MKIGDLFLNLQVESAEFRTKLQTEAQKAGDAAGKTLGERIKSNLTAANIGTVVGAAFGAAMIPALKMADEYDNAMDSLRAGTGATGDALAGLEQSFKNAAGRVKEDIGVTAAVMADLNTRTGLTGQALEDLTVDVIEFSRVTGTDATANTASITRLFGDWSIATEDQAETLDQLLRASQSTGLEVDRLMQTVVQFGAPLRLLGFSFEESIALLGKWEKEGVNTETMLQGLKQAVKTLANEGVPANEMAGTLRERIEQIGKSADPVSEAIRLFGVRAGPDLAAAILEGRFSIDDLVATIENGSETVDTAAGDMRDFGDGIAELKNKVKLAVGPILQDFAGLGEEMGNTIYLLPALVGGLGRVTGALWTKVAALAAATGGWKALALSAQGAVLPLAAITAGVIGLKMAGDELAITMRKLREEIEFGEVKPEDVDAVHGLGFAFEHVGNAVRFLVPWATDAGAEMADVGREMQGVTGAAGDTRVALESIPWEQSSHALNEIGRVGTKAAKDLSLAWKGSSHEINESFSSQMLPQLLNAARELGTAIPGTIVKGMQSAADRLVEGARNLRDILENGLAPRDLALIAIGKKNIKLVRQGMDSEKEGAVDTARGVAIASIDAIENAGLTGRKGRRGLKAIGIYYDELLASGLTAGEARVALTAGDVSDAVITNLENERGAGQAGTDTVGAYTGSIAAGAGTAAQGTGGWAGLLHGGRYTAAGAAGSVRKAAAATLSNTAGFAGYGSSTVEEYRKGLASKTVSVRNTVNTIANIVRTGFRATSPPENPLTHDIRKWGRNTIEEYAAGLIAGLPDVQHAIRLVASAYLPLGGLAAQPALAVPSLSGSLGRQPVPGGSSVTNTRHVTINIHGGDLEQIRRVLREEVGVNQSASSIGWGNG